jgi:pimeloyl-ACP methyl ester carboxylesterase
MLPGQPVDVQAAINKRPRYSITCPRMAASLLALAAVTIGLLLTSAPANALRVGHAPAATSSLTSHRLQSWRGYIPSTDGVRIWVQSVGGGAPGARVVVLVHGGPGLSLTYLNIFDQLASSSRQIVSYDQRGAGLSTRPANHNYGLAAQISDLEAVRHWTGAQKITIVGHSWGGLLAAAYTATYPDHVAALALVDALPVNWTVFVAGENRIGKRITTLQSEGLIPNPLPPIHHNSCLAEVEALTPAYLANPREHVNRPKVWGSSCTESTDLATFNAFDHDRSQLPSLATALGKWPGQALVMQGAEDPFGLQWLRTSVAELRSATVQQLTIAGAGHFPWVEHPRLVLRTINQFTQ